MTIEEILTQKEGQTFDCKSFGEGVDRMCRKMTDMDMEPPTYHLNTFILKATAKNRGQTREVWGESNKESNKERKYVSSANIDL